MTPQKPYPKSGMTKWACQPTTLRLKASNTMAKSRKPVQAFAACYSIRSLASKYLRA